MKGYSGEDTKKGAFWENNTMSKFTRIGQLNNTWGWYLLINLNSYLIINCGTRRFKKIWNI